ncbi:hypothetical protein [Pseudomonas faucium]|uniref:hypothetical protein n=2 Tax=Pseudomonas faucium TaxID=2740518 RepID=UPI001F3EEF54|nr:hypothetical protein [Pseudomonas faucium]
MNKQPASLFLLLLTACGASNVTANKPNVTFSLNDSIKNVLTSSTMQLTKDCSSHVCFYEFSTSSKSENKGTALVDPNQNPLSLNNIVGAALITYKTDLVENASIRVAPAPSNSEHSEFMQYFNDTLVKLRLSGWQRYILPNEARVPGSEASKFKLFDEVLGVPVGTGPWKDPTLKLSQAEWLAMPTINNWYFHKNGNYLLFRVQRENTSQAPQERGSYLFSFNFQSEAEFYKNFVPNENQDVWVKLLPAELKRMAQERAQTEARLKQMGIAIDENYQDPPIKALE